MTQHALTIANQAGASFRSDIVNALQALGSEMSGATAPATTYAYMPWADSTSGWLKQRNAANSAWIFVQPLAGHAEVGVASATTTDLGAQTSDMALISGTTTITGFGTADAGRLVLVRHSGILTLTHNGTSLILPGAANITTAAGDTYEAESLGSGNWVVRAYQKASGAAVVGGTVAVPYTAIAGFILSSIAGTNTTAACTVSAGQATALQGSATTQTTQITKATTTSWAASNGNAINGTDAASSTLANSTTYHVYMCSGASGTGSFVSASLTPTFPTGYAVSARRVGWFNTNGSGAPLPKVEVEMGGGDVLSYLTTKVVDINGVTPSTANRTLYAVSGPVGYKFMVRGRGWGGLMAASQGFLFTSPDEPDVAVQSGNTGGTTPGNDLGQTGGAIIDPVAHKDIITNTSAQIGARSNSASANTLYWHTDAIIDFRRV
jgi:hypothetical protein